MILFLIINHMFSEHVLSFSGLGRGLPRVQVSHTGDSPGSVLIEKPGFLGLVADDPWCQRRGWCGHVFGREGGGGERLSAAWGPESRCGPPGRPLLPSRPPGAGRPLLRLVPGSRGTVHGKGTPTSQLQGKLLFYFSLAALKYLSFFLCSVILLM